MSYVDLFNSLSFAGPDGVQSFLGAAGEPVRVQVDGSGKHVQSFELADAASKKLYDSSEDISNFEVMALLSSEDDVYVEIVVDQTNAIGKVVSTICLLAGVPVFIPSKAYANYSEGFAGGTIDQIDKVTVKNMSGETAQVSVLAFL